MKRLRSCGRRPGSRGCRVDSAAHLHRCRLAEPLVELHERFTNVHRGFRKLLGEYRRDKRTVAAFTTEVVNLDDAVKRPRTRRVVGAGPKRLRRGGAGHGGFLGSVLDGAQHRLRGSRRGSGERDATRPAGSRVPAPQVATSAGGPPDPAVKLIVEQTRADMARLRALISDSRSDAARPELLLGTVAGASEWLRAHLQPLVRASTVATAVGRVTGRELTAGEARTMLAARDGATAARAALAESASETEAQIGAELYRGLATDLAAVRRGLTLGDGFAQGATRVRPATLRNPGQDPRVGSTDREPGRRVRSVGEGPCGDCVRVRRRPTRGTRGRARPCGHCGEPDRRAGG